MSTLDFLFLQGKGVLSVGGSIITLTCTQHYDCSRRLPLFHSPENCSDRQPALVARLWGLCNSWPVCATFHTCVNRSQCVHHHVLILYVARHFFLHLLQRLIMYVGFMFTSNVETGHCMSHIICYIYKWPLWSAWDNLWSTFIPICRLRELWKSASCECYHALGYCHHHSLMSLVAVTWRGQADVTGGCDIIYVTAVTRRS